MLPNCVQVHTESGSIYQLTGALRLTKEGRRVLGNGSGWMRRVNENRPMRDDNVWVPMIACDLITGECMRLLIDLPDTPNLINTIRMTTPVVAIARVYVEDVPNVH